MCQRMPCQRYFQRVTDPMESGRLRNHQVSQLLWHCERQETSGIDAGNRRGGVILRAPRHDVIASILPRGLHLNGILVIAHGRLERAHACVGRCCGEISEGKELLQNRSGNAVVARLIETAVQVGCLRGGESSFMIAGCNCGHELHGWLMKRSARVEQVIEQNSGIQKEPH